MHGGFWLSFFDQNYSTPLQGLPEPKMTIHQTLSIGRVWRGRRTLIVFLLDNRAIPRDLVVPPATPSQACLPPA